MTVAAYRQIIAAPVPDRRDLFLAAANRIGMPLGNVEKDFWVAGRSMRFISVFPKVARAFSSKAARRCRKLMGSSRDFPRISKIP